MGETITTGYVQQAYNRMMDALDKAQWKTYTDPITEVKMAITEKSRDNLRASASMLVAEFKSTLSLYLAAIGIK